MDQKNLSETFDTVDNWLTSWMARNGVWFLRVAIGLVYIWFGALKLFPGASPAEGLIRDTITFLPANLFIPFLAIWEIVIGLGFLTGRYMRLTILLMMLQIGGAVSPLVLNPGAVFVSFPFVLTLEGQYIIKNVVLIAAAIVVGATVRGGGLSNGTPAAGD
ncbi:MAG: DoxX family membrane protein [Anaerolineales bacterium]|nr:DoxX family membrane protein [Anaerolineales bacterium]